VELRFPFAKAEVVLSIALGRVLKSLFPPRLVVVSIFQSPIGPVMSVADGSALSSCGGLSRVSSGWSRCPSVHSNLRHLPRAPSELLGWEAQIEASSPQ